MTFQKKKNQEKLSQFHIFHNFFPDFLSLQATEKLHFLHFFSSSLFLLRGRLHTFLFHTLTFSSIFLHRPLVHYVISFFTFMKGKFSVEEFFRIARKLRTFISRDERRMRAQLPGKLRVILADEVAWRLISANLVRFFYYTNCNSFASRMSGAANFLFFSFFSTKRISLCWATWSCSGNCNSPMSKLKLNWTSVLWAIFPPTRLDQVPS